MRRGLFALVLAAAAPLPALAQTAQTAPAPAPDPARIAAAQALIARIMPPARINETVDQMMRPMMANLRNAMLSNPEMQQALEKMPKAKATFDTFLDDEFARSIALTKQWMPTMLEAMARAYARRFTTAQMAEIGAFFDTPTGKVYAAQASTIMADPDMLAAQRTMMTKAMEGLQQRAQVMAQKIAQDIAAEQDKK
ncbi:DUF2059 domain-containing protein [uncultured Sphingomonas sp.]|uniref:DUF2059 domain-containing protein n=1 Tax=uncultured Sphingomonas sp. TaxID=158754 RepID=UPI0025D89EB3|nr:DUF2059 domain-containing protein [uncultured Sphingomonas sp.]